MPFIMHNDTKMYRQYGRFMGGIMGGIMARRCISSCQSHMMLMHRTPAATQATSRRSSRQPLELLQRCAWEIPVTCRWSVRFCSFDMHPPEPTASEASGWGILVYDMQSRDVFGDHKQMWCTGCKQRQGRGEGWHEEDWLQDWQEVRPAC